MDAYIDSAMRFVITHPNPVVVKGSRGCMEPRRPDGARAPSDGAILVRAMRRPEAR